LTVTPGWFGLVSRREETEALRVVIRRINVEGNNEEDQKKYGWIRLRVI